MCAGLFFLKQLFHVSDEELPRGWVENRYWQYFCGERYFRHEFPIHPRLMTKWRDWMREEDAQGLLSLTLDLGLKAKTVKKQDINCVDVDTTVQEQAIRYPTDSKLVQKAIYTLGKRCKETLLPIKQNYKYVSKKALFKVNNDARAQQHKRKKKWTNKLKTYLGRLKRDIERQLADRSDLMPKFCELLQQTDQLLGRTWESTNKRYSLHAPETGCIAKVKVTQRYEFGVKVSVVATQKNNFMVGIQTLPGLPYEGHTLVDALNQTGTGVRPRHAFVDSGYRGHEEKVTVVHVARKKSTYATRWLQQLMKRCHAIEALFSHVKRDGQLKRNDLKGRKGDQLNALLSAVGHNLRLILCAIRLFWLYTLLSVIRIVEKNDTQYPQKQPSST